MENLDSIFQKSLKLRPSERLMLIERIASSLDNPDTEIDKQWAEEAEKRYKAYDEGRVQSVSLSEIIEKYR